MQIKKIASFDVRDGASTVRYADLDDGISFFPTDGIINIKSNKVRIAGFGVDSNSLYRINSLGAMYPLGDSSSVFLSNEGLWSSASIGGSSGSNKWVLAISNNFGVTDSGTLYARNASIEGTITAKRGNIASYTITDQYLMSSDGQVGMSAGGTSFWAGYNSGNGSYKFRVTKDGYLYANNADISGTISNSLIKWKGNGDYGTIEAKNTTMRNISGIDGQSSHGMVIAGYLGSSVDIGIRATSDNLTDSGLWDSAIHINGNSTVIRNPGFDISSYIKLVNGQILIDANSSSADGGLAKGSVEVHGGSGYYTLIDWMRIYAHTDITGGLTVDGQYNGNNLMSAAIKTQTSGSYLEVVTSNSNGQAYGCDAWVSDARLKNTIEDTSVIAIPIIKEMEFKQFNWNKTGYHVNIGLIAQDLEKISPDLIMKIDQPDGSVIYQVNAPMVSTITAKAVQEIISKVDTLESNTNIAIAQAKSELETKFMTENQELKNRLTFLEEKEEKTNG